MAIKKTELYRRLWAGCNLLRGGMDASQYKDYVLAILFIKYISDKWAGKEGFPDINVPLGSSFTDMVNLKGSKDIGDQINKKIIDPIEKANELSGMPDFNDATKLGYGKDMVDRLDRLIAIFEDSALNFNKNKAEDDDILGDAYEFLMRHFATESGKSKGQFYTPAEVSRTMAAIIGINKIKPTSDLTVYDPTCGSGSLLLRVGNEAQSKVTLYGQEKDATTAGLARMNMILHNKSSTEIIPGNTLANPLFLDEKRNLKTFDFVVANPPFSDKSWSNGLILPNDKPYNRFAEYGTPPDKNGDYAYLLHIVRSLKRKGKGAVILPHGVFFRGNSEAEIRTNLIKKGYIKGIIGLPTNLFYGTSIPAAIILIDKENSQNRKSIFMIDASKGFIKDGNKNRLREQDIRKITDVFNGQIKIDGYSRMVSFAEIKKNEYNLGISRYIDNQKEEDMQDIEAHLKGGIPTADIDTLKEYWEVFPSLRKSLFKKYNKKYTKLTISHLEIQDTIFSHPEFVSFINKMDSLFNDWKKKTVKLLNTFKIGNTSKELIGKIKKDLLAHYEGKILVDKYDVFQHLMSYWSEIMQDDCHIISEYGWKAIPYRITTENKQKKKVDKGWSCDLVPKELVIDKYFATEVNTLTELANKNEIITDEITELEEEHNIEDGYFAELDKINKVNIAKRLKELKDASDVDDEIDVLNKYLKLTEKKSELNKQIKETEKELDTKLREKYPTMTEDEVKRLVIDDKWLKTIEKDIKGVIDHVSQRLTNRIKELAERYETPLPEIEKEAIDLEKKVTSHLKNMGFVR